MSTPETSHNVHHLLANADELNDDQLAPGAANNSAGDPGETITHELTVHLIGDRAVMGLHPILPEVAPLETEPQKMYARVLPASEVENCVDKDDASAINIFVTSDHTIKIGERELELSSHELYLFNALLKLRASPALAKELQAYGFSRRGRSTNHTRNLKFSETMANLSSLLRFASGQDVVAKSGPVAKATYKLDEKLVVTDRRVPGQPERKSFKPSPPRKVKEDKEKKTHYKDLPFEILLNTYGQHHKVKAAENRLVKNAQPKFDGDDILGDYMNMAGQYDLLKQEEVEALYNDIEAGLAALAGLESLDNIPPEIESLLIAATIAQRTMFLSNMRLVISIAHRFQNYDKMDLIHEGNDGLNKTIARYNYHTGFKFSTYATGWIKQAMQRAIANQARPVRLPVKQDAQSRELMRALADLTEDLKGRPSTAQLMEATGFDEETITAIQRFGVYELPSLDAPLDYDSQLTLIDIVEPDRSTVGPESATNDMSDKEELFRLLFRAGDALSNIEKAVLTGSYQVKVPFFAGLPIQRGDNTMIIYEDFLESLPKDRDPTNEELGKALRYAAERIRQIRLNAFVHLRQGPLPPKAV